MRTIPKKLRIKTFGITREILGGRETTIEFTGSTVGELRTQLLSGYPRLAALRSLMVAVNNAYADDGQLLNEQDEIALIPPVSGG